MYTLWKWSTIVLVLQALFGLVAYWATSSVSTALWASIAAALLCVGMSAVRPSFRRGSSESTAGFCLSVVAAVSIFPIALGTGHPFWIFLAVGVALIMNATAVWQAERETGENPFTPAFFLAGLPFGIGTTVGGVVLLHRRLRRLRVPAG